MQFHSNFRDAYHEAPKLVAISALLMGVASQFQPPYQAYMLSAGVISGVLGIMLKKDQCE